MKKKSKRALKGFTLIELVVVVAVFGLLIAATLSFVTPTRNVYKSASEYAGASGMVDNVRRIIEDNLRFANRMDVYAGPDVSGGEEAYVQARVNELRHKFHLDDSSRVTFGRDRVYVMKIDNPEEAQFPGFAGGSQKPGRISIWQYDNGTRNMANSKEWAMAEGVYDEYSFSLSFGINFTTHTETVAGVNYNVIDTGDYDNFGDDPNAYVDPANFSMTLDIYKNFYDDRANRASSSYRLANTSVSNAVALCFVNMVDGSNTLRHETIDLTDTSGTGTVSEDCGDRYTYHDLCTGSRDIYFVYTIPDLT